MMKAGRLLVFLLFTLAAPALADDTAIQGVGGAVSAMEEHPSVVMEEMEVAIDLYPHRAEVECGYLFRNTGPAVTVRMGFPEGGNQAGRSKHPAGFTTFHTTVDGKSVPTRIEGFTVSPHSGEWQRWRVKAVSFAAGQTRRVTVQYTAPLGIWSTGEGKLFRYEVRTGSSWNGPIGSAKMLLRGHYDPDRGWLRAPAHFRRTGPTAFEWTARDLEPKDDVELVLSPGVEVRVAGKAMDADNVVPPYPYASDGEGWAPVRMVANWLRAELNVTESGVTLVRGDRSVTVQRGREQFDANGRQVALSKRVHIVSGRLMAPLVPVAEALGGMVAWDPSTRVTDIGFAFLDFLPKPEAEQRSPFSAIPEGFAPPELSDYDPTVLADLREAGYAQPWRCVGDFTGDGFEDIALFVQKRSLSAPDELWVGTIVLPGTEFGWQTFSWLGDAPRVTIRAPGELITVLRTQPPGEVSYYEEGESGPKSGRLQLEHDAVEIIAWGKAATLHYWDGGARRYERVITGD